jgi:hypothetical protein
MQASAFLLLNGVILVGLVLRLLMARKPAAPTPLNITKSAYKPVVKTQSSENTGEKTLNCYFMHNGLMMDAFEILGVPSGADKDTCYRAYVDLRSSRKEASVVEGAWAALQQYF